MRYILLFLFTSQLYAVDTLPVEKMKRSESEWCDVVMEHILLLPEDRKEFYLPDDKRIDILDMDAKIAYEVDWAYKWTEGYSQARSYAIKTNTTPGLILLIKNGEDEDYLNVMTLINDYRCFGRKFVFIIVNVENLNYWRY